MWSSALLTGGPGKGGPFGGDGSDRDGFTAYGHGGGGGLWAEPSSLPEARWSFKTARFSGIPFHAEPPAAVTVIRLPTEADAGGAIFCLNCHLTVQNVTISGNLSTGSDAGITVYQSAADKPTSFILENTIIYGNGGKDGSGNPIGTEKSVQ